MGLPRIGTSDDFIQRAFGDPEYIRKLRAQRDRLKHDQARQRKFAMDEIEARNLRNEIKQLGEEPCA